MSITTKVARLARSSIIARSQPMILRSSNDIKDREQAFEKQYVEQKERLDRLQREEKLKKEKQQKEQQQAQANNKAKESSNAARIKELEAQIAALQKELNQLKK